MTTALEYGVPTHRCGLQLRLGIEKGFFRAEGIELALRIVFGGPEIAAEFDSGRLKIGELGTPPGLTALAKGARFKIVGSGVRRGAVQYLVMRPGYVEWSELRGARLGALSPGSCSYWFLREILAYHGLDPDKEAEVVGLGPRYPQVVELIVCGKLDGAVLSEPSVSIGEYAGHFHVWLALNGADFVPRMQWTIAVANDETIVKEPGLVAAVLRGCRRSYRYAAKHPDEWAEFGSRHFGISREIMVRSIEREFRDLHFDCEIDLDGLEAAIALQQRLGAITRPLRVEDIIDFRFQPKLASRGLALGGGSIGKRALPNGLSR